jgi:hypothetical protein
VNVLFRKIGVPPEMATAPPPAVVSFVRNRLFSTRRSELCR